MALLFEHNVRLGTLQCVFGIDCFLVIQWSNNCCSYWEKIKLSRQKLAFANLFTVSVHISWEYILFNSVLGQCFVWKTWSQKPLVISYNFSLPWTKNNYVDKSNQIEKFCTFFIILNTAFLTFVWKQILYNIQMTKNISL